MAKKPNTTKTLGPLHFEDLEPRRFEDLVRGLLVGFRDWYKIEPTGRAGNDGGFDTRAWERLPVSSNEDEDGESAELQYQGNLWQIQCKRESAMGPTKVENYVNECLSHGGKVHGFILAAPAEFSKTSRDKFRDLMTSKGIREFYLWGKGDLENMLLQVQNGHLLYTFFGISINLSRKSRISELKYSFNNKNKLIAAFGISGNVERELSQDVIVRDINDKLYPFKKANEGNSEAKKMWAQHIATNIHPQGLILNSGEYYAYVDHDKKEYDYCEQWDLRHFQTQTHHHREELEFTEEIRDFWECIPFRFRRRIEKSYWLDYEDILSIDRHGDSWYPIPHIFLETHNGESPYVGSAISDGNENISDYKRVDFFPKKFNAHKFGKIIKDEFLKPELVSLSRSDFDAENRYYCPMGDLPNIKLGDVVGFDSSPDETDTMQKMYEVIDIRESTVKLLKDTAYGIEEKLQNVLGRKPKNSDKVRILELRVVYEWKLERLGLLQSKKMI